MTEQALFDPGFAPLVYSFSDNLQAITTIMRNIKNPNQRKFRFNVLKPQIIALMKNSIAFYFGCLMWAKYLKEEMPNEELLNNPFYGVNLEEQNITEEDICNEINLVLDYFEQYKNDCKFYLDKPDTMPEEWHKIATIYKEFLLINKSFVKTKSCSDIILPVSTNTLISTTNKENKELIDNVLLQKDITILLQNN